MHSLLHHTYTCIAIYYNNKHNPPDTGNITTDPHQQSVHSNLYCQTAHACTHTQAHTHATHAHICTPIAPGFPMAACGRETSWLSNNSLSLRLPQHPYAKMFLCEQGAPCTLTPPNWPSDMHFNTHKKKNNQNKTQKSFLTENKHM